jgi:Rrf2 family protein
MLSKKAKYALKALLMLSREAPGKPILISEIARAEDIPKKFLEMILLQLKKNGMLQSKKGKGGGYFLARDPSLITFGQVIRVIDGPLAPLPCVSHTAYMRCEECADENTCGIRLVMKEVRDSTARILDGTSFFEVVHRVQSIAHPKTRPGRGGRKR